MTNSVNALLELAATAAGWSYRPVGGHFVNKHGPVFEYERWNPLESDCDAFQLANELKISITHNESIIVSTYECNGYFDNEYEWGVEAWVESEEDGTTLKAEAAYNKDKHAATRRVIVSVAAELGRRVKSVERKNAYAALPKIINKLSAI